MKLNELFNKIKQVTMQESDSPITKNKQDGVAEGADHKTYLSQIPSLEWSALNKKTWRAIRDEGLEEEQDTPNPHDWVMAQLAIDPADAQALQAYDADAIEEFSRFDIHLKQQYPGLVDLIDYDAGTVTIVKVKQGVAEGDYNPDTLVGKKGTYKGYGITQEGPHQWGISSSSRKFTTLNAAKQHIDKNLIDGVAEGEEDLDEVWSQKYKKSINCSHPKGFSQKAHCAGKKKHNESVNDQEMQCPDCGTTEIVIG